MLQQQEQDLSQQVQMDDFRLLQTPKQLFLQEFYSLNKRLLLDYLDLTSLIHQMKFFSLWYQRLQLQKM